MLLCLLLCAFVSSLQSSSMFPCIDFHLYLNSLSIVHTAKTGLLRCCLYTQCMFRSKTRCAGGWTFPFQHPSRCIAPKFVVFFSGRVRSTSFRHSLSCRLCGSWPFSWLRVLPPCALRPNSKCYSGKVWAISKYLGEKEGYSGHHSANKPSGLVHEACQIASAHAQEQGNIPKTNVWLGLRSANRVMLICIPPMNDCSQSNHCNVTRARNGYRNFETHAMDLCFVACLGRVWLNFCHTEVWTILGAAAVGSETCTTGKEESLGCRGHGVQSCTLRSGEESLDGFVCEWFIFTIWHFGVTSSLSK